VAEASFSPDLRERDGHDPRVHRARRRYGIGSGRRVLEQPSRARHISGHHPPSGDHANIIAGSINGQDIQSASIGTAKLNAAAQGARAYGLVVETSVTRSKNITSVTNPNPGTFCIALGGFIAASTASAVVTPDYTNDSTNHGANSSQAFAEVASSGVGCPAGNLEVLTGYRSVVTGGGGVTSVDNNFANEGFFIVVG
jgi:hypothetical protein